MLLTDSKKISSFLKKTLVMIHSKQEFDRIVEDPEQISPSISKHSDSQQNHQQSEQNKQEIVVPRIGRVSPQFLIKNSPKLTKPIEAHGYFRLRFHHTLPNPQKYDLTQQDMQFIRLLKKKYNFNKKYKFQSKTFIDIIESCEHSFHKLKTVKLHWDSERYLDNLNFNLPMDTAIKFNAKEKDMVKRMILQVVDYWKKQKIDKRSFPLLRMYWPKTDIAMGKYTFWMPYKTRIVDQPNKKSGPVIVLKNFGNTEKQKNMNKQAKEASNFYSEVKGLAEIQQSQHTRSKKEVSRFHKNAEQYGFKFPDNLTDVIQKRSNPEYMRILQRWQKSVYFTNPIVKLTVKSRYLYRPSYQRSYQASYNPHKKLFNVKTNENSIEQYETQMLQYWGMRQQSGQNHQIGHKISKKFRNHSFHCDKKIKGSKKVKIQ